MARKRSAFVPRAVLKAGFASVIPTLALIEGCSTGPVIGVAGVAYCCFDAATDADASDAHATDSAGDVASDVTADVTSDGPKE